MFLPQHISSYLFVQSTLATLVSESSLLFQLSANFCHCDDSALHSGQLQQIVREYRNLLGIFEATKIWQYHYLSYMTYSPTLVEQDKQVVIGNFLVKIVWCKVNYVCQVI